MERRRDGVAAAETLEPLELLERLVHLAFDGSFVAQQTVALGDRRQGPGLQRSLQAESVGVFVFFELLDRRLGAVHEFAAQAAVLLPYLIVAMALFVHFFADLRRGFDVFRVLGGQFEGRHEVVDLMDNVFTVNVLNGGSLTKFRQQYLSSTT